ncbi:unnamed protein product [Periconia digitata]|uniref:Uncharacterized protein n=1 Tax=Periconia digitata TaxID=1303443 RepID=A0A9W4XTU3_9PLEO|nr:unnamed protein product [Periconia digitata]
MTAPASPQPIYHDTTKGRARRNSRRSSQRKSHTSGAGSYFESPRIPCPPDGDAFSYNPTHLSAWSAPNNLLEDLPDKLKEALTAVQHSGAAVLTGFDRLEDYSPGPEDAPVSENLNSHDLSDLSKLPSPRLRIPSAASSNSSSDLASPVSMESSFLGSPAFDSSQSMTSVSPICLTPSDSGMFCKRELPRDRSFTLPTEPNNSYYRTELSHLRTEAIPRLRHASIKVDTEYHEAKRLGHIPVDHVNDFEAWWSEQKSKINDLNEKGRGLSNAISLTPTGLGWTAP